MDNVPVPSDDLANLAAEDAELIRRLDARLKSARHGWALDRDVPRKRFVWTCSCGDAVVYQPFGTAVPDRLVSHPREHGQMRGEPV